MTTSAPRSRSPGLYVGAGRPRGERGRLESQSDEAAMRPVREQDRRTDHDGQRRCEHEPLPHRRDVARCGDRDDHRPQADRQQADALCAPEHVQRGIRRAVQVREHRERRGDQEEPSEYPAAPAERDERRAGREPEEQERDGCRGAEHEVVVVQPHRREPEPDAVVHRLRVERDEPGRAVGTRPDRLLRRQQEERPRRGDERRGDGPRPRGVPAHARTLAVGAGGRQPSVAGHGRLVRVDNL